MFDVLGIVDKLISTSALVCGQTDVVFKVCQLGEVRLR